MANPTDDSWLDRGAGGISTPVHALVARRNRFTVMALRRPNRFERDPMIEITTKPYTEGSAAGVVWQQRISGESSGPSPALSDDTLVACRETGLTYFAPDGAGAVDPAAGFAQGKVIAQIDTNLRIGLVSADGADRVWGFRAEDGALVGWDARGQSLGPALPLEISAVQPPVALQSGAIAVIASGAVLKIDNGAIRWRAELPPSAQPLATATADRDGKLLVRAGKQLVLIDENGKRVWNSELPAEITSNPLITSTGRLCVAAGLTLYCSQ
jgi:hypothetical protein